MPDSAEAAIATPSAGFLIGNLSILSYARGFTLWHYRAGRTPMETMLAPGFLDAAQGLVCLGDLVILSPHGGGNIAFVTTLHPHVMLTALCPCEAFP